MSQTSCEPAAAGSEPHFWERSGAVWHAVFALGMITAAIGAYTGHGIASGTGIALLVIIVALTLWYLATGARALGHDRPRLGHLYLCGLVPAFGAMIALDPSIGYMLFFAVPQLFIFLDRLLVASLAVVGLYVLYGAIHALIAPPDDLPGELAFPLAISMTVSLLFGGWIHGIIQQSAKRAELIAELERTRAELAAERHDAGVLAERARLAAEIHDTLAQGFTSVLMLTQAAEVNPDTTKESLTLIERTARENLAEARSLVAALSPAALDGSSLPEALRRLTDGHREATHADVALDVSGEPTPHPETDVVLLRAAQETLANVRKHASAGRVRLRLAYAPDGVTLAVSDDGAGFDPSANGTGFGLRGMRRRVEQSGGTMTVTSEPGTGTTVKVQLP